MKEEDKKGDRIITKYPCDTPIVIPSLKRYTKHKKPTMMIDACLKDLFRYYDATSVHVVAQEYEEADKKELQEKYPIVKFYWYEKRMGIINTFNVVKTLGCSLGECYFHKDDDTKFAQQFDDNPTLLAMVHVMKTLPSRVGIVTVPSISIHHFSKYSTKFINVHGNPAQLVLINSAAAKTCTYDSQFENFRSDTDFTMQIASKGFVPIMVSRYFSFMHTIPLAKLDIDKEGKRKFKTLDNVTESRGSIGGDRRMEMRIKEFDAFSKKWPKVITMKSYRQQVLKKSITYLSKYTEHELQYLTDNFDYSLIKNFHEEYYGKDTPEALTYNKLFG